VVAIAAIPEAWREDMRLLSACISGATDIDNLTSMLSRAGFTDISIRPSEESRTFIKEWQPEARLEDCVLSAAICAVKPG